MYKMVGYWDLSQITKDKLLDRCGEDKVDWINSYPPIDYEGMYEKYIEEYSMYPDPHDFIDVNFWETLDERFSGFKPSWDDDVFTKADVIEYLSGSHLISCNGFMGWSDCRICSKHNGSHEWTDLVYIFPEGLVHYVEAHDVRLPDDFLIHILREHRHSYLRCAREYEVDSWINGMDLIRQEDEK